MGEQRGGRPEDPPVPPSFSLSLFLSSLPFYPSVSVPLERKKGKKERKKEGKAPYLPTSLSAMDATRSRETRHTQVYFLPSFHLLHGCMLSSQQNSAKSSERVRERGLNYLSLQTPHLIAIFCAGPLPKERERERGIHQSVSQSGRASAHRPACALPQTNNTLLSAMESVSQSVRQPDFFLPFFLSHTLFFPLLCSCLRLHSCLPSRPTTCEGALLPGV